MNTPPRSPAIPPPPPPSAPPPPHPVPPKASTALPRQPMLLLDFVRDEASQPAVLLAFRIAIYYFIFGVIWIAASDYALDILLKTFGDPYKLFNQTVKGWFFIVLTAGLLFFVVRHFILALQRTQTHMRTRVEGVAEQYRRLFHSNPSAMLIFDPGTRQILAANDVALRLYGFSRDELLSMRTVDLVVEEERPRLLASVAYDPGMVQSIGPFQVRRRDGRIIFIEAVTHHVDFDGHPARIALVMDVTERLRTERSLALYRGQLEQRVAERTAELSRMNVQLRTEVTERMRVEEELRAATEAAQAANNAKSTFLAQTSHEIRTPLTSILGYADLLQHAGLSTEDRVKYLDIVRQNARHLSALIDDLLDLSRAEMGNVKLVFAEHSPRQLALDAVGLLQNRANEQGIELRAQIIDPLPETIHADGVRLRQILLNLMDNAVKFTLEGNVTLIVRRAPGTSPMIYFEVTDTGVGIDPEFYEAIFEPFFQIEQGSTRRFGGSGLGLAVSRQLARLMGGDLVVAAGSAGGSRFTLSLPMGEVEMGEALPEAAPAAATTLQGNFLLAEDNDNIRLLVNEYLARAGATVTEVVNGLEAVDRMADSLAAGSTLPPFDLVLLDLHMPVLDGLHAMKRIRQLGYRGPIVGLTADFAENSIAPGPATGWDAVCAKPIDRQTFLPLLSRLIEERQTAQADAESGPTA